MGRHLQTIGPGPRHHYLLDVQLANGNGHVSATKALRPDISPLRLTPREETTRVQLQRQRLKEQHRGAIVSKTIPGFKTSAGR
jgi:hypothetical protein